MKRDRAAKACRGLMVGISIAAVMEVFTLFASRPNSLLTTRLWGIPWHAYVVGAIAAVALCAWPRKVNRIQIVSATALCVVAVAMRWAASRPAIIHQVVQDMWVK